MPITVTFGCGHTQTVSETSSDAPVCAQCQDHRVTRTTAPPPRFSGFCSSPVKG